MAKSSIGPLPDPGGDPDPDPIYSFRPPEVTELQGLVARGLIRADSEQQQQQQQQQQSSLSRRRFLNLDTQLPEEEVVTKLAVEIRQINKLAKRT